MLLKNSDLAYTASDYHLAQVGIGHSICATHGAGTGGAGGQRGARGGGCNIYTEYLSLNNKNVIPLTCLARNTRKIIRKT